MARSDCLDYRVRTLSNAQMYFVVGGINQYWRYGDSGDFTGNKPHLLLEARDGLPHTLKMRKQNEAWEGAHVATFTGNGSTAEFTITGTVGTIGYVWVDGTRKTYNTDYTYGSNKITFKSGKIPANGAAIQVEWMDAKCPWTGSALYRTFNDADYGIIKLIQTADAKLYSHIYKGPNAKGMRYYAETRSKTNQQAGAWEDRGLLFLPTEDEVWGRLIHTVSGANGSVNQQQQATIREGRRQCCVPYQRVVCVILQCDALRQCHQQRHPVLQLRQQRDCGRALLPAIVNPHPSWVWMKGSDLIEQHQSAAHEAYRA